MTDNACFYVTLHSFYGSTFEAVDPEWTGMFTSLDEAEEVAKKLNEAIEIDPGSPDAYAQVIVGKPANLDSSLSPSALWNQVRQNTCCLSADEDDDYIFVAETDSYKQNF